MKPGAAFAQLAVHSGPLRATADLSRRVATAEGQLFLRAQHTRAAHRSTPAARQPCGAAMVATRSQRKAADAKTRRAPLPVVCGISIATSVALQLVNNALIRSGAVAAARLTAAHALAAFAWKWVRRAARRRSSTPSNADPAAAALLALQAVCSTAQIWLWNTGMARGATMADFQTYRRPGVHQSERRRGRDVGIPRRRVAGDAAAARWTVRGGEPSRPQVQARGPALVRGRAGDVRRRGGARAAGLALLRGGGARRAPRLRTRRRGARAPRRAFRDRGAAPADVPAAEWKCVTRHSNRDGSRRRRARRADIPRETAPRDAAESVQTALARPESMSTPAGTRSCTTACGTATA